MPSDCSSWRRREGGPWLAPGDRNLERLAARYDVLETGHFKPKISAGRGEMDAA
jgi:hypothetical protein